MLEVRGIFFRSCSKLGDRSAIHRLLCPTRYILSVPVDISGINTILCYHPRAQINWLSSKCLLELVNQPRTICNGGVCFLHFSWSVYVDSIGRHLRICKISDHSVISAWLPTMKAIIYLSFLRKGLNWGSKTWELYISINHFHVFAQGDNQCLSLNVYNFVFPLETWAQKEIYLWDLFLLYSHMKLGKHFVPVQTSRCYHFGDKRL